MLPGHDLVPVTPILALFMFPVGNIVAETYLDLVEDMLKKDIDLIVRRLREKRTQVREGLEVGFVDREREARTILEGVARIRLLRGAVVLYGPKGCGKSTFFEKMTESVNEVNKGGGTYFEAIYVKRDEVESAVKAMSSGNMSEIIFDAIKSLDPSVSFEGGVVVSAALSLGRFFGRVVEALSLSRKAKDHGRILVVMDERKVESRDLRAFESELESLADSMRRANLKYYQEKRGYITAMILTSDALAARAWQRVGGKVDWLLMWNLPRGDFERLADQLGVDMDRDLLWRLTGGNPRALEDILASGLDGWLAIIIKDKVMETLEPYWDHKSRLVEAIREITESPDNLGRWRRPNEPPIAEILLRSNITIRIAGLPGPITELPKEPWIGERYAFQLPAYYYTLKAMARKEVLEVAPGDVRREALEA